MRKDQVIHNVILYLEGSKSLYGLDPTHDQPINEAIDALRNGDPLKANKQLRQQRVNAGYAAHMHQGVGEEIPKIGKLIEELQSVYPDIEMLS